MISKLRYGNSIIKYNVVKSKRRKTSEIRVDESGVEIRTPIIKKDSEIQELIDEKKQWIFKKQLEFKDRKKQRDKNLYKNIIIYFGKDVPLKIKTRQKNEKIHYSKNQFIIYLKTEYSKKRIQNLYEKWLLEKACKYLVNRTEKIAQKTGIKHSQVIVKSLKSRWGSATNEGVINLNSKLLKSPKAVIDYIIIHELCHLKIGNHSTSFWSLVERHCPDFQTHRNWLEDDGITIL